MIDDLTNDERELDRLIDRMCDQVASLDELGALGRRLADDPAARDHYIACLGFHARLAWQMAPGKPFSPEELLRYASDDLTEREDEVRGGRGQRRGMAGSPAIEEGFGFGIQDPEIVNPKSQIRNQQISSPESPAPPIILDLSGPLPSSFSPFSSFVGGPVFSYMVAAVILGMMLLGAWAYKINRFQQFVEKSPAPSDTRPELVFVGQITNMVDCRWADARTQTYVGAAVPLGRKYALSSGLMEVTYKSGARVILQGPCTYEVESGSGGYLALGKLIARVEKDKETRRRGDKERMEGRGGREEGEKNLPISNSQNHSPLSTLHSPLFSVRTPTAIVTDLGTEFGVEVDSSGGSTTHVFRGKVALRAAGPKGQGQIIELGVEESARVEAGSEKIVVVPRGAVSAGAFVRRIPQRGPIRVFNTGKGLIHGESDPHWHITACVNNPDFKPQPAVVTAVSPKFFRRNRPGRSQWISTDDMLPLLPEGTTYTFQTTFHLNGEPPEGLELRGAFAADNHVEAIRFNGRPVAVPEHGYKPPFYDLHPFSITDGFVEGKNVLELDVSNGVPNTKLRPSRMVLLVELEAVVGPGRDARDDPPKDNRPADGGKETDR